MIRVVLVDDQELVRTGLRSLAENDGDISVVAEAANGRSGLHAVRETRPDVVLMDIRMPELDGLAATASIVADADLSGVRVLIMTTFDDDDDVFEAIRAGAAGYLLKDISPTDLRQAIRVVAAGESLLSPAIAGKLMRSFVAGRQWKVDDTPLRLLTDREKQVLVEIAKGCSNDEIARTLYLSPATARTYASRLLSKLHARDRSQLVVLAYETGLVRPGG